MVIQQKNKRVSFALIWVLAFICLIGFAILLLVSFSLYDNVFDKKNFSLSALLIPDYKNSSDEFRVTPINYDTLSNKKDRNEFKKMLVKQYIVNRYTVNGRNEIMDKNLGLNSLGNIDVRTGGVRLKRPSIKSIAENGQIIFDEAYNNFMTGRDGEIKEIEQLIQENTTRSVRIVNEPRQDGDWIVTTVEFIYRTPTTYSFSDAKKELYQIRMYCDFTGLNVQNFIQQDASSVFRFRVWQIKKERL